jgi:hypothetical protein
VVVSEHFSGHAPASRLEVLESFWRDPAASVPDESATDLYS